MLSYLSVKHFAIIENIEVSFEKGMTVLTGETGAGKSLLIDAIGLLLGDRASSEVVRSGEKSSEIIGIFNGLEAPLKKELLSLDVDVSDDQLMIKRVISLTGANIIKLNDQTVTLQDLKRVTRHLADIHTQHDTRRLIAPEMYLYLLDQYDTSIAPLKETYQHHLNVYKTSLKAYEDLIEENRQSQAILNDIETTLQDIAAHHLIVGEEEDIESRLHTLHNYDTIFQAIQSVYERLEIKGSIDNIYEASRLFQTIQNYDESYKHLMSRLESAYFELDDIKQTVSNQLSHMDFDPNELEQLEMRAHDLKQLRRKYARSIDELIDYQAELEQKKQTLTDFDSAIVKAEKAKEDALHQLTIAADSLTKKRQEVAKSLEIRLIDTLADLQLKNAGFKVDFDTSQKRFKFDGQDQIDFLLTTNLGEPLKPLSKVASGGECSRIMLALKTLLIQQDTLALMIFDEIDAGVSGFIADQVGLKMYQLSASTQVFAITHLPQVAAWADHHYHISKTEVQSRTKAVITPLNNDDRIDVIAAMLASDTISETHKQSAVELLNKHKKKR